MTRDPSDPRLDALFAAARAQPASSDDEALIRGALDAVEQMPSVTPRPRPRFSPALVATAAAALGVAGGFWLGRVTAPPPRTIERTTERIRVVVLDGGVVRAPERAPPPPPVWSDAAARPVRDPGSDAEVEAQRVQAARLALRRGAAVDALEIVGRLRRSHPRGALVEERDAIAVEALVALGRSAEARAAAERFAASFPQSLYAARLAELLRAVPDAGR